MKSCNLQKNQNYTLTNNALVPLILEIFKYYSPVSFERTGIHPRPLGGPDRWGWCYAPPHTPAQCPVQTCMTLLYHSHPSPRYPETKVWWIWLKYIIPRQWQCSRSEYTPIIKMLYYYLLSFFCNINVTLLPPPPPPKKKKRIAWVLQE